MLVRHVLYQLSYAPLCFAFVGRRSRDGLVSILNLRPLVNRKIKKSWNIFLNGEMGEKGRKNIQKMGNAMEFILTRSGRQ